MYIFDIFYKDIKWYFIIILYLSLKISVVKLKRFCICTKKTYSPVTGKYQQKTIDYRSICEAITDNYLADLIVKPAICCLQYFVKKVKKSSSEARKIYNYTSWREIIYTQIRLLSLWNEIKLKLIEFILQHRSNEGTASSVVFQK